MNKAAKEIWYVWDGLGDYPDTSKVQGFVYRNGEISRLDKSEDTEEYVNVYMCLDWSAEDSCHDIVAYTLGETRERVECEDCGGYGFVYGGTIHMMVDGESIPNYITEQECTDCKGRGYIWKSE